MHRGQEEVAGKRFLPESAVAAHGGPLLPGAGLWLAVPPALPPVPPCHVRHAGPAQPVLPAAQPCLPACTNKPHTFISSFTQV